MQPRYTICTHDPKVDKMILGWITNFVGAALERTAAESVKVDDAAAVVVFVDVGANIGVHSLFAARLGFENWAV